MGGAVCIANSMSFPRWFYLFKVHQNHTRQWQGDSVMIYLISCFLIHSSTLAPESHPVPRYKRSKELLFRKPWMLYRGNLTIFTRVLSKRVFHGHSSSHPGRHPLCNMTLLFLSSSIYFSTPLNLDGFVICFDQ